MKLKERFKKGLFAFFKAEILEAVEAKTPKGVQYVPPMGKVIETRLPYRIVCSILFDEDKDRDRFAQHMPLEVVMERKIQDAKKELFNEFAKHVEVEIYPLIAPAHGRRVEIILSCFVGKKP